MPLKKFLTKLLIVFSSFVPILAFSCTGINLTSKDGHSINGRTLEFGIPLDFAGLIIPRNYVFKGTLPDGHAGMSYQSKYAVVGSNTYGAPAILDGLNEKGLTVADFYFPGYAQYAEVTSENKDKALSPTEFSNWILTQFSNLDEVKKALNSVVIVATKPQGWAIIPPLHYIVYDKSGKSIVIEPLNGKLKVYDNPLGIFTNSPTFDWHMTNLANYNNLSPLNAKPIVMNGLKIEQFGQGSGLHGLPGDFTSPSRFVRAAFFAGNVKKADNAEAAVLLVFHLLNQFDIPLGAVRQEIPNKGIILDYTMATTVKNPDELKYYFRTYDDQSLKMLDLKKFNWNDNRLKQAVMIGKQNIIDISNTAK